MLDQQTAELQQRRRIRQVIDRQIDAGKRTHRNTVSFATRCFVAQAVEEMINGESTFSRYAALLDVLVPTVAVIVFMLCRSSGFGLQASLFDGATVIGIGLLVSHRLTRPKRPRS